MKKLIKLLSIIIFSIIFIFVCKKDVQAKSYSIENIDIQATIKQDGSVSVEQELTYDFNGQYNGIYIDIPHNLEDTSFEEIGKNNMIDDDYYTGSNIYVSKVATVSNNVENEFMQVNYASNGNNDVYTITDEEGIQEIKIFSPSQNTKKTFKIDYTIENLCVKHNDIGELYYNFIGGQWDVEIKNLNIDIYIPQNTTPINIWAHGPYNGQSKIIDNTHSNFKVKNIKPGQYVATRILFDKNNIPNCLKTTQINAKELVFQNENEIIENKEQKNLFTLKIGIVAVCLLIYWIILMAIFENDKKYPVSNIQEEELFKKYNPMLARMYTR